MISWKGVPILLEALQLMRSRGLRATCVLCGNGPDLDSFKKFATDIGIDDQLTWQDASPSDVVADLMNQSKAACIPSTWDEPFGIVALEAMACGCKVIATNAGGLPDAVGPCGLLFEKGNATALADAYGFFCYNIAPTLDEFRDIITAQIEAFRADDGPAAYTHAAPKIRQMFPTPDDFMALVKRGYPQVYRPQTFTFGPVTTEMRGQPTQRVTIVDGKGKVWTALYAFEKQEDGSWKINGVMTVELGGEV
jgi:hypothetical protein